MEFEIWHIWLIAGITFFILEIFVPSFVLINFGIGAVFASIGAALGMTIQWQVFVFSIFSLTSFFLVRPVLKKWAYKRSANIHTNQNALIGRIGLVNETIDITKNSGRVKIDGDVWMARSCDGKLIDEEVAVKVTKVDSIVVEVERI